MQRRIAMDVDTQVHNQLYHPVRHVLTIHSAATSSLDNTPAQYLDEYADKYCKLHNSKSRSSKYGLYISPVRT